MYGLNIHNPLWYVIPTADKQGSSIIKTIQNTAVAVYKIGQNGCRYYYKRLVCSSFGQFG